MEEDIGFTGCSSHSLHNASEVTGALAPYGPCTAAAARGPTGKQIDSFCAAQVRSIYVGNLPETVDEMKLRDVFSAYGQVGRVNLCVLIKTAAHF